jgi:small subunit ribosomal protein S17
MEEQKNTRRFRIGRVIADNTPKTVKIEIEGIVRHARYKKFIKQRHSFLAHDPQEVARMGDLVKVEECRPISKLKKWVVREVIEHGKGVLGAAGKETKDDLSGINP